MEHGAGWRAVPARPPGAGGRQDSAPTLAQGRYLLGLGRLEDAEADFRSVTEMGIELQERSHGVGCQLMLSWIAGLRGDDAGARFWFAAASADLALRPTPGDRA